LHGLQGLQGPQPFFAAQGLHAFAAQGLHAFLAAHGLQAPQPFFLAAQGLHNAAVTRRGMAHFRDAVAPPAPQGLQGLQAPQPFFAAQGLHGLQAFLAAQGLQAPQPFFAAQGLQAFAAHGLQAFLAAQGLQAPQPFFLAAQGLQAPQPRFLPPQGLQAAATCMGPCCLGAAGALGSSPRATAVGLPPLAPGAVVDLAKATSANGMAVPAARAAPMTTCNTDVLRTLLLVDRTILPPAFICFFPIYRRTVR